MLLLHMYDMKKEMQEILLYCLAIFSTLKDIHIYIYIKLMI